MRVQKLHYWFSIQNWKCAFPSCLASWLIVSLATSAWANATNIVIAQAPENARRIVFQLTPLQNNPNSRQNGSQPLEEVAPPNNAIARDFTNKESFTFQFFALKNNTRYFVTMSQDTKFKSLSREDSSSSLWYGRAYRQAPETSSKPELLREGCLRMGNDVLFPVEVELPGIGATKLTSTRLDVGFSFNGMQNGKPMLYARSQGLGVQLGGFQVLPEGKLSITLTVPEELVPGPQTPVSLRFDPLSPGFPERVAASAAGDFLTLGTARFIVSEIASDFSTATVAVLAGNLDQIAKDQTEMVSTLPPFSQIELLTRASITRETLLERAKTASGIVIIFGDIGGVSRNNGPMGAANILLPLPPTDIATQLQVDPKRKPVVVFVTRQLTGEFLYQDLRNKTPDFLVLTDYSDPLKTALRSSQYPGGYYSSNYGIQDVTLRQLFNLPERLNIAAFDRNGKVAYVKSDATKDFLVSLAEARDALKAAK
jgi:hypothetical protein